MDFLIYKGPLGLAALYLSLGTKDIPNHYLLRKEFQYIGLFFENFIDFFLFFLAVGYETPKLV